MAKEKQKPKIGDVVIICRNKNNNYFHKKNRKTGVYVSKTTWCKRKLVRVEIPCEWGKTSQWYDEYQIDKLLETPKKKKGE